MVVASGGPRQMGEGRTPRLRFGQDGVAVNGGPGRRVLLLDDEPAFELSFWCGTCQFLFQREPGANTTVSLAQLTAKLGDGLDELDEEVVTAYGDLLAAGTYLPLLLEVRPRLTTPAAPDDYFAREQVVTWGLSSFWGLPESPRTPYYRTFETAVSATAHLFEFVVPMVPPSWNDAGQVAAYRERLASSSRPTAVGVSTLDVCAPAVDDQGADHFEHWGLSHFLLDGHHKMEAAAVDGRAVRLLSLLSVDGSLADRAQVERIPALRAQPSASRVSAP